MTGASNKGTRYFGVPTNSSVLRHSSVHWVQLTPVADALPTVIQVVNVLVGPSYEYSWTMIPYVVATVVLYLVQLALTLVAVWVIVVKTKQISLFHGHPVRLCLQANIA